VPSIHLIEKLGKPGLKQIDRENCVWDSGYWKVTPDNAANLVGGDIYLHTAWAQLSHFGGVVTAYTVYHHPGDDGDGSVVFRFHARREHKDVKAPPGANGEKRIFW
jgi:hypothetical protein